jgi:putative hydrolase of the HAD superfamily
VRALLLDLDDTLLDYSGGAQEAWVAACHEGCAARGLPAGPLLAAMLESRRWFWSDPERHRRERVAMLGAWRKIVEHAMDRIGLAAPGLDAAIALAYRERLHAAMRLFPDAVATLEALRAREVALGLVTNGDAREQREKIARHGLERFFDTILIEGEFGTGKPEPVVFLHVLDQLGVAPADAAMVGDRLDFDVCGSQAAGINAIWLDRAGQGLPAGSAVTPDRVVRTLAELLHLPAASADAPEAHRSR